MPGKLFYNDVRLNRARAEGLCAADGTKNPHPAGSPEYEAWQAGYDIRETVEPVSANAVMATFPSSDWLKADIQAWLTDAGIDYPSDATKADLLLLVP